jgi:hypothetical protein
LPVEATLVLPQSHSDSQVACPFSYPLWVEHGQEAEALTFRLRRDLSPFMFL